MPKIILRQTRKMINVLKGNFTGEFDLSVQDQNGFYNDYIDTENVITDLSIAADPKLGAIATVRIIGGSLASDAIPTSWNFSGDVISQDEAFYNEIIILYVSSTDIRIVNRLVDAPDLTAPVFSVAPTATNIAETSFDITATLNENGTVYGYLLANGSPAPDTDTVIANAQDSFIDVGSGGTLSFTGLIGLTDYDVYVVAEDDAGNKQASPTLVEVQTTDAAFNPATISLQYLWQKLNIATTDADPVTLATDSLTTTPYNFTNVGTVPRAIQNGKECVRFNGTGNHLQSVSTNVGLFMQNTFSVHIPVKLDDGRPSAIQYMCGLFADNSNRFAVDIRTDGKITVTYTAGGQASVFAQTAASVFADGASADFDDIDIIATSGGAISIHKNNVLQSLNPSFAGDLSGTDMSLFNSGSAPFRIGAGQATTAAGASGMTGWINNFILQPVTYTSQNRIDLGAL